MPRIAPLSRQSMPSTFHLRAAIACAISVVALSAIVDGARAQQAAPTTQGTQLPPVPVNPPAMVQPKQQAVPAPAPKLKSAPQPAPKVQAKSAPKQAVSQPEVVAAPEPSAPKVVGVGVGSSGLAVPATTTIVSGDALAQKKFETSDTTSLINDVPGVNIYQAGGVSGLPSINGLADDRIKIAVAGMAITSACANHMNSPLSYSDPAIIGSIEVLTGVTPVSKGGDSIAGTIIVEPAEPKFAAFGQGLRTSGSLSSFYRSNNHGYGANATAEMATTNMSLRYDGALTKAQDYHRGGDGAMVRSTEFEARNQTLTLSARSTTELFTLQGGVQKIPYQGYVNQRMDMVDNGAQFINGRYINRFAWGKLDARLFYQQTSHEMNFLEDKFYSYKAMSKSNMPMRTEGKDYGYSFKLEIPVSQRSIVRIGNELQAQKLDDWWPPICSGGMMCMMGPLTYKNINNGTRDRIGTFGEWETKLAPAWTALLGVRNDVVRMDADQVQPYAWMGMMNAADAAAAAAFNARNHQRTDVNFDATALLRFEPNASTNFEAGYARKTRSPNLYERYSWGMGNMSSSMIGWFGDANGYVGNLDLKPEIAHTASVTAGWHDSNNKVWSIKATPYYTFVQDFIDVDPIATFKDKVGDTFAKLRFANHDARLYGVNVSGTMPLYSNPGVGRFALTGIVGYVHGERTDGGALYHIMPLNGRISLSHGLGNWSNVIEAVLVDDKTRVDARRSEFATPGYAIVNLRSRYDWENVRFDLGVENVFDKLYYSPLGGADYADYNATGGKIGPVPGMGRSFNAGVTVKF